MVEGERAMGRHLHKPAIVSYWRARRARALVEMPLSLARVFLLISRAPASKTTALRRPEKKKKKKKKTVQF